jgi:LuxR family transcriptional regulator, quorum-sensing system regulator LasR
VSPLLESCSAFAAECERIATMDGLARGVCALVKPSGYHGVASGRLGRSGGPGTFHFANWPPGWLEFYLASGFLRIDPVPLWALACGRPIGAMELRALVPRGHPSHKVFDAARCYGIGGGYIVPQRAADNQVGAVAFVGPHDPRSAGERFALRALAGVVFDRAEALSGRALPPRIPLPPPELTKREQECLQHLVAGRSTSTVAKAMAVSEATVRFHAANLKMKTGAANRAELTALAVSLGLAPQLGPEAADGKRS